MPMKNGLYTSPTWANATSPAIGATELNVVSDVLEDSQIRIGDRIYSFQSSKTGYLECDGSTVSSSTYPDLVATLTGDPSAVSATLPVETFTYGYVLIRAL